MSDETITAAPIPIIRKFMDHTITLRDDWSFNVDGPEFEGRDQTITFHSLEAAKAEILKRHDETQKLKAQNTKLEVRLVGLNGTEYTITKINRRSASMVTDLGDGHRLLPAMLETRLLIERRKELNTELQKIESIIEQIGVRNSRAYGSITAERYPDVALKLQEEVQTKRELVKKLLAPEPEPELQPQ